jgi:hypothetical protein
MMMTRIFIFSQLFIILGSVFIIPIPNSLQLDRTYKLILQKSCSPLEFGGETKSETTQQYFF